GPASAPRSFRRVRAAYPFELLDEPGGRNTVGEPLEQLLEQRARLPPVAACEELTRRPVREHVHRAAEDMEHLAGDRLSLVGAERDDDRRVVPWRERVEAAVVRRQLE